MALKILNISLVITAVAGLSGCSDAVSVPLSDCDKVVAHASKVLAKFSPNKQEMLEQCQAATDEARGCAMAAQKPMALSQCDF